jgi:hypothetical protein
MRMSASWFGSWTHRIQGRGTIDPRPESGLPSDRHPDRTKRAVVLEAVKVWPGKGGVRRKVGATANLDSSCARRLCNTAGWGEETGLQVEQRNRSRDAPLRNRLTKKAPYKVGWLLRAVRHLTLSRSRTEPSCRHLIFPAVAIRRQT